MKASWEASVYLVFGLVASVAAADTAGLPPPRGRGFVFGISLGAGRTDFGGEHGLAIVVGESLGIQDDTSLFNDIPPLDLRAARIVPLTQVPPGAVRVKAIPGHQHGVGISVQMGWSFSPRVAALADVDFLAGGWDETIAQGMVGLVLRYSPHERLWFEAGPAQGDLSFGYTGDNGLASSAQSVAGKGTGVLGGVGVAVLRKPSWLLDVQARVGTLWYEQIRATNVSVHLGWTRRKS